MVYKFITQSITNENIIFAAFSLDSHSSSVTTFNGLNFSDWCEQIKFHLRVLDLDVAL